MSSTTPDIDDMPPLVNEIDVSFGRFRKCKNCGDFTSSKVQVCSKTECGPRQKHELYLLRKKASQTVISVEGEIRCSYIHRDGTNCIKIAEDGENRCMIHINSKTMIPCFNCGKMTFRKNSRCTSCTVQY